MQFKAKPILLFSAVILILSSSYLTIQVLESGTNSPLPDIHPIIQAESSACDGDLNLDGQIDHLDLEEMVTLLLQGKDGGLCANLNEDQVIDILDLQILVNRILNPSSGNIYYVSASGNDSNPGTIELPWKTIQNSVEKLEYGDTLYVFPGTYQGVNLRNVGGDSDTDRIAIRNLPGARPIISGSGFQLRTSRYITLSGFELDGVGIDIEASDHITVENNLIHHTRFGIFLGDESHDCIIRHNEVYGSELGSSSRAGEVGIRLDESHHNLIEYNICYNMFLDYANGDGIGIYYGSSYNVVSHNIMHDNPDDGLDGYESSGYNIVEYNISYRAGYGENGQITSGNGVGMKTNYESHHWIVRHNVSYGNTVGGISDEDSGGDNIFYNNTTYNNHSYGFGAANSPGGYVFANNVSSGDRRNNISLDRNKGNIIGNLEEASNWFINPANGDFHLRSDSPLIDGGIHQITGTWITIDLTDFQGIAPDSGAFEYGNPWDLGRIPGLFDGQQDPGFSQYFRPIPDVGEIEAEYNRVYNLNSLP
jgi:parallel beta-helix repeat protein